LTFVWWKALAALAVAPLAFGRPHRALVTMSRRYSTGVVVAGFAATRLAACLLAFVVLDLRLPGDIGGQYATFAEAVLAGGRHESSPYSQPQRQTWRAAVLPVSAFEPSLWFHLREGEALSNSTGRLVILAADLTLVAGYVLVARRGLRARPASLTSWQAEAA
jgi:hypothetical protein